MRAIVMEPEGGDDVIALFGSWERSDDFLDNDTNDWTAENTTRTSRKVRE